MGDQAGDKGEVLSLHHASSSFNHDTSRKRVRVSAGPAAKQPSQHRETPEYDSPDASENEVEEEEEEDRDERHASPPRTQYELMRDDGFRHLEHQDIDDQRATQMIKSRSRRMGDNRVAENGIIESVECINFMCHERLYVELGPLINFIVGENGSGKSAVLTALTLCLGGKASSTNRGGSLKSFIKEGRDQSVITVCIKNQGSDAYQPDIYGQTIQVERHFSRSGASGFKLKNERGKTISTKKADIDEITEYWGLQVDNPLNVLSQDNARQFLNSASPSVKYKYFFKGVQLEQLDNNYKLIAEVLGSHEEKLAKLKDNVAQLERELQKAQKDKELADANHTMRAEGRRLRTQIIWCQVAEAERELARRRAEVDAFEEKLSEAARAIETTSQQLEDCDERVRQAEATVAEKSQEKDAQGETVDAATSKYKALRNDLEKQRLEERDAYQRAKTAEANVDAWTQKVAAEERRIGESSGDVRKRLEEQLREAEAEEASLQQQIAENAAARPGLNRDFKTALEKVKEVEQRFSVKKQEVSKAADRIRNFRSKNSSPFAAFDSKIPQLLKAIEHETGFERQPVGPIGTHIQLLNPLWSSVLESTFGQFLNGFLVASKRDQQRLLELMRRLDIRGVPILIGAPLPPGTKLRQPEGHFLTILRALKIDNDWVRDQLVINYSIEKIILVENRTEAESIMFGESPPRDVIACLSLHDKRRDQGLRLTARASMLGTSTISAFTRSPRMKSDLEIQLTIQEEALQSVERELHDIRKEKELLEADQRQSQLRIEKNEQARKSLGTALTKAQGRITTLNEENDQYEGADGRLAQFQEELKNAQQDKLHHGSQYGEMVAQKQTLNKKIEEQKKVLEREKGVLRELEAQLTKAEAKLKQCQDLRQIALLAKNKAYDTQAETQEQRARAERERDQQAQVVAEYTAGASAQSPERVPIDEGETHASLEKKYHSIVTQLEQRRNRVGATDEEINDRLREAKAAYQQASQVFELQSETQQTAKLTLAQRLAKWRIFQALISAHSRIGFQYLLSERGFRGNIIFDHKARKLQLSVEPDETRKKGMGRSTKTLSGGEKSFSSICMLLSIWEAMGSPLRCLDEFDVFMDNVNRTISTNMLITAARRVVTRQYIMITPNAIEGRASLDRDVKIIRLTDPRQRRLV
ncbi:P-loop containing nucleoside triphosphate hydrolase protein [Sodiomyces alkalinus F11]|uniref:P-loop containing nucleoside triphosphate hydrolase protein n=1 Tax=Sodiomyces alkalinus (strain CBS 110278 / VKM F-3762 / F11) TaxID=1314773 RepID=A0A3N2Q7V0_SODAK|nr:P-loop containing nucleoside triphosphate hydrolase protein [Sodiomyces alkalinus F11]ROT42705.1 P-loop containing nucleoside triphosphate hydrolase protein [Sodiomyces alkalinus F11]